MCILAGLVLVFTRFRFYSFPLAFGHLYFRWMLTMADIGYKQLSVICDHPRFTMDFGCFCNLQNKTFFLSLLVFYCLPCFVGCLQRRTVSPCHRSDGCGVVLLCLILRLISSTAVLTGCVYKLRLLLHLLACYLAGAGRGIRDAPFD